MSLLTNYQSYKLQAYAQVTINGVAYLLDLASFTATFAVNTIPTAELLVTLGRDYVTGRAASVHFLLDSLKTLQKIEVFLQVSIGPSSYGVPVEAWPPGYFRIFDGYVSATGYDRSRGQVALNISATHWLDDLNFSSALTRSTCTVNMNQLSGFAAFVPGGGQGVLPAFAAQTMADNFATSDNISQDFWGKTLGPWLWEVCGQDVLADPTDPLLQNPIFRSNFEARRALTRFEPAITKRKYIFGVPLSLPLGSAVGIEAVSEAIGEDVTMESFESMAATTIWDKIVLGYGANYRFGVVPLVNTALVVPLVDGFRLPWQIIYGEEYDNIQIKGRVPRPVRGVRLFTGFGSNTGAFGLNPGGAAEEPVIGGTYDNPLLADGQLLYAQAPRWAANIVAAPVFGRDAARPGQVRGNGFHPGQGANPQQPGPAAIRPLAENMLDRLARSLYTTEAIRGRFGSIRGKLRFDIAPGSTVQIFGVEDRFVEAQTGLVGNSILMAEVMRVTVAIDAESAACATSLELANVRSFIENSLDAYSTATNPLWGRPWNGAPLIEHTAFVPTPNPFFTR